MVIEAYLPGYPEEELAFDNFTWYKQEIDAENVVTQVSLFSFGALSNIS